MGNDEQEERQSQDTSMMMREGDVRTMSRKVKLIVAVG